MNANLKRYITISEGSALSGKSTDTIKRRRENNELPSARPRPGDSKGTWEFQIADLVAIGLLDASTLPDEPAVEELLPKSRAERDLQSVRQELAVTKIKLEATQQALERADREIAHHRKVVDNLSKTAGGR